MVSKKHDITTEKYISGRNATDDKIASLLSKVADTVLPDDAVKARIDKTLLSIKNADCNNE